MGSAGLGGSAACLRGRDGHHRRISGTFTRIDGRVRRASNTQSPSGANCFPLTFFAAGKPACLPRPRLRPLVSLARGDGGQGFAPPHEVHAFDIIAGL
jgi:hypothetical protein